MVTAEYICLEISTELKMQVVGRNILQLALLAILIGSSIGNIEFSAGEAVRIVEFDSNTTRPKMDYDMLKSIIDTRPEISNMPTIFISIGGVARSGKSFLLNLFVSFFSYLEKHGEDAGWEESDTPVTGVNWAQSRTTVTHGMWIWNKPFIIRRGDGTKIAVLLMDSQGTGDNSRSDIKLDTMIMYLSLQISSVQIFNVKQYLSSNDLTSLQLCADYADVNSNVDANSDTKPGANTDANTVTNANAADAADADTCADADADACSEADTEPDADSAAGSIAEADAEPDGNDYLFGSLIFLIRDYQSGDDFGEDPALFPTIIKRAESEDLKRVALGIQRAFQTISSYKMPRPGDAIASASAGTRNWKVKDVPHNFLVTTKSLIRKSSRMDQSGNDLSLQWLTAEEQLTKFKLLSNHLENDDLPTIMTPTEALRESILLKAYTFTIKQLLKALTKKEENKDLEEFLNTQRRIAYDNFNKEGKHTKYSSSPSWRQYQDMLDQEIDILYHGIGIRYQVELEAERDRKMEEKRRKREYEDCNNCRSEREDSNNRRSESNGIPWITLLTVAAPVVGLMIGGEEGMAIVAVVDAVRDQLKALLI